VKANLLPAIVQAKGRLPVMPRSTFLLIPAILVITALAYASISVWLGNRDDQQTSDVVITDSVIDAMNESAAGQNPEPAVTRQFEDDPHCMSGDQSVETPLVGTTIIIDPGHGGEDLGTVNMAFELHESDIVLTISELLRDGLTASGANVCLTRVDDVYIELLERAEFANDRNGDAFVSVHLNSLPDPNESYTMTMWGNEAKDRFLAEKLLDSLVAELVEPATFNGEPNPMGSDSVWLDHLDSNMLRNAEMPAVLVEGTFLSATWEAQAFQSGIADGTHWREHQIASAIHEGLISYFAVFNGDS
jgi:N-acetylmuramoyl-L-alanine amidase